MEAMVDVDQKTRAGIHDLWDASLRIHRPTSRATVGGEKVKHHNRRNPFRTIQGWLRDYNFACLRLAVDNPFRGDNQKLRRPRVDDRNCRV